MALIVEFYVPTKFQRKERSQPQQQRGKLIEFCAAGKKSA
jgi:hypothetical protein